MDREELRARLPAVTALAQEAAARAARLRAEGGGVASMKGAQDFVTAADGAVERFLRERLGAAFPGEAVLGEEMGGAADGAGPLWVLDPIDGTSNFARGGDRWCVSIGLVVGGRARLGVVARHAPAQVFAAAEGCGATLDGVPIHAAPTVAMDRATIEVGWSLRRPAEEFVVLLGKVMATGAGTRIGGSGTLGMVETAAGRLDGYLELHINSWDVAAALVIAREAGCWVTPFDRGNWLTQGDRIGVGAPALTPVLEALIKG